MTCGSRELAFRDKETGSCGSAVRLKGLADPMRASNLAGKGLWKTARARRPPSGGGCAHAQRCRCCDGTRVVRRRRRWRRGGGRGCLRRTRPSGEFDSVFVAGGVRKHRCWSWSQERVAELSSVAILVSGATERDPDSDPRPLGRFLTGLSGHLES